MPGADVSADTACHERSRLWIATPAIAGVLVALVSLVAYFELAEDLTISPLIYAFDVRVTDIVQAWRAVPLTWFFRAVTWGASSVPITLVCVAAIAVLMWLGRHRDALFVALVVAVGSGIGSVAKHLAARPRPPVARAIIELPTSYSFPSGHTLAALLLWSVVCIAVWRATSRPVLRWLVVALSVGLTLLTALSRVYLGVHWPSDTVASMLLGTAWLTVCIGGFLTWDRAVGPPPC